VNLSGAKDFVKYVNRIARCDSWNVKQQTRDWPCLRSRRKHKAWGVSPRMESIVRVGPTQWATGHRTGFVYPVALLPAVAGWQIWCALTWG